MSRILSSTKKKQTGAKRAASGSNLLSPSKVCSSSQKRNSAQISKVRFVREAGAWRAANVWSAVTFARYGKRHSTAHAIVAAQKPAARRAQPTARGARLAATQGTSFVRARARSRSRAAPSVWLSVMGTCAHVVAFNLLTMRLNSSTREDAVEEVELRPKCSRRWSRSRRSRRARSRRCCTSWSTRCRRRWSIEKLSVCAHFTPHAHLTRNTLTTKDALFTR